MAWHARNIMSLHKPVRIAAHLIRLDGYLDDACSYATRPGADRQRAAEVQSVPQRDAFLAARKLLLKLLAAQLGCPPAAVPICRGPHGKPRLAFGNTEFSLSHRDRWCAVALWADAPVGIDVEPIRTLPGMTEVVAEFFPLAARAAFASAPPEEQEIVFFRWWTRIEAAVKVSGRGLDAALSCFNDVTCQSFEAVPGLAVAVAAEGEGPLIVDWQVDRNLSWLEPEPRRLYVASSRLVCQKTG